MLLKKRNSCKILYILQKSIQTVCFLYWLLKTTFETLASHAIFLLFVINFWMNFFFIVNACNRVFVGSPGSKNMRIFVFFQTKSVLLGYLWLMGSDEYLVVLCWGPQNCAFCFYKGTTSFQWSCLTRLFYIKHRFPLNYTTIYGGQLNISLKTEQTCVYLCIVSFIARICLHTRI